jgi:Type II secretion system (T2SS), protein E, N-terminal domain
MGGAEGEAAARAIAERWQLEYVEAAAVTIDPRALSLLAAKDAQRLRAVPLALRGSTRLIALAGPSEERFAAVRELTGQATQFAVVSEQTLDALLASRLFSERQPARAHSQESAPGAPMPARLVSGSDPGKASGPPEPPQAARVEPAATTPPPAAITSLAAPPVGADGLANNAVVDPDSASGDQPVEAAPRANGEPTASTAPPAVAPIAPPAPSRRATPAERLLTDLGPDAGGASLAAAAYQPATGDDDTVSAIIAAVLERLAPQLRPTDPTSQPAQAPDEHAPGPNLAQLRSEQQTPPPPTPPRADAGLERAQQALREAKEELAAAHANNDQQQKRIHALEAELVESRELTAIAHDKLQALARLLNPDTTRETHLLNDDL